MQYKIILSALLLTATAAAPSRAQLAAAAKSPVAIVKKDSVVTLPGKSATKSANPQLASNMPATADSKKGYNHVPLAGEKAYFGDKNEYVNDFVRKYLESHNRTLGSVQSNSITPFSVIDNVLEQKNLPKELKYLAVIESALNHNAVSHAGAVGPWQLMESTARMMGLNVTRRNDDRKDWYKSTTAATKYLELLYGQLNDWLLVIAAYNSGPTPVQRAIDRTGSRNFWDIKEYLPRETQGHVLAFIATASIFENFSKFINLGSIPVDFKFGKEEEALAKFVVPAKPGTPVTAAAITPGATAPASTMTAPAAALPSAAKKSVFTDEELKNMAMVRITQAVSLEIVAQELSIDKKTLVRWNQDYDQFIYKTYPTPFYNLRIPKDRLDAFLAKKDQITKKSVAALAQQK